MNAVRTQNIWCVGRNFAAHAKEMKAPVPSSPLFFLKSGGCLNSSSVIKLPDWSDEVHHEIELAFLIDENLSFSHVSLALDLTARPQQEAAKKAGQPWTLSKSFTGACPIGLWVSLLDIQNVLDLQIRLKKNKLTIQQAFASEMIFKPSQLLDFIKKHFPVSPGDILLTGTPEGVGKLSPGDILSAEIQWEKQTLLACHWDVT